MRELGKRIVVVGVSASGKTTFARRLAQKTNLPLIHIDEMIWNPGWKYIGDEASIKQLYEVGSGAEWIIEGYIEKGARDFVFERADTIIHLDYHPAIASWRYLVRWWKYRKNPRPELPGSPEKFSFKFLKLVWTKGEDISLKKALRRVENFEKIITCASPQKAERLVV